MKLALAPRSSKGVRARRREVPVALSERARRDPEPRSGCELCRAGSAVGQPPGAGAIPPGSSLQVATLTIEELAAGKFAALVQRTAARDAFDAANLLDLYQDLLDRPSFRIAFICSAATSRTDAREFRRRGPRRGNARDRGHRRAVQETGALSVNR